MIQVQGYVVRYLPVKTCMAVPRNTRGNSSDLPLSTNHDRIDISIGRGFRPLYTQYGAEVNQLSLTLSRILEQDIHW